MKSKKTLVSFVVALALSLFSAFTVFSFVKETRHPALPVLGQVPAFHLEDATGETLHSESLQGKVWIANFFFTTCGGICPILSEQMARLSRTLGEVEGLSLVSITVNPEQDSPRVLARYAQQFQGDKTNWHFLTGSRSAITRLVAEGFKVGDIREPVFHSALFPLVDSEGRIRGYYDGTKSEEIDRLSQDAVLLVKEMKK